MSVEVTGMNWENETIRYPCMTPSKIPKFPMMGSIALNDRVYVGQMDHLGAKLGFQVEAMRSGLASSSGSGGRPEIVSTKGR